MQIVPLDRESCVTLTCSDPALLTDCPAVGRYTGAGDTLFGRVWYLDSMTARVAEIPLNPWRQP